MILRDFTAYYVQDDDVSTATFTKSAVIPKVAEYSLPSGTKDTVERTYFNAEHVKKYGLGYEDMGEFTMKIDLDTDSLAALVILRGYYDAEQEVCFGFQVSNTDTALNQKFSVLLTNVPLLDSGITPGTNAVVTITGKVNSKLSAFTEPTA